MESFLERYKGIFVLLAVVLAQMIGLATQMRRPDYLSRADGHHVRIVRGWAAYTIVPVEKLFWHMGQTVRGVWSGYIDLRHVRQHDKDLQYQIDQLRLRAAGIAEDARQGQRLEHLLAFKQAYVGKTVAAQVIGMGGGDRSHILVLNKGSNEGIAPDMAVITPDGIVGKIRDVYPESSQLLLMNDSSSGVGVILTNVRSRGVLRGTTSGAVQIGTLLPDDRIKPGETVVTSGGDRVFPRGLSVGTVRSVSLDPEHQPYTSILIQPAANLDRLEEVLVITDVAQQLVVAETTNTDADPSLRKASEIVAERLPGLHNDPPKDGTTATPPDADAKEAAVTTVKTTPALRPDRYTPGAVPNAGELKPGARHDAGPATGAPN